MSVRRLRIVGVGFVVALGLGLTACNGRFLDNPETPTSTPSESSVILPDATVSPDPQVDVSDISGDIGSGVPVRADFENTVTVVIECQDAPVTLDQGAGAIVALNGDCPEITISGSGVVVLMGDIGTIGIMGSESIVFMNSVSDITISGNNNIVSWTSQSPTVDDSGESNQFGQFGG